MPGLTLRLATAVLVALNVACSATEPSAPAAPESRIELTEAALFGTWQVDSQLVVDSVYAARDPRAAPLEPQRWQFERTGYPVNAVNLQAYPTAPVSRYPFLVVAPDTLRMLAGTPGPGFDRIAVLFTRHLEIRHLPTFPWVFPGSNVAVLDAYFVAYLHRVSP